MTPPCEEDHSVGVPKHPNDSRSESRRLEYRRRTRPAQPRPPVFAVPIRRAIPICGPVTRGLQVFHSERKSFSHCFSIDFPFGAEPSTIRHAWGANSPLRNRFGQSSGGDESAPHALDHELDGVAVVPPITARIRETLPPSLRRSPDRGPPVPDAAAPTSVPREPRSGTLPQRRR